MNYKVEELLNRRYNIGSIIINCIGHSGLSLLNRPRNCELCQTDIVNQLSLAIKVNEFLNTWKDDATLILKEFN